MHDKVKVLDHGYVQLVTHWGSDEQIVEAARMSTGKGFLGWDPGPCEACSGKGKVDGHVREWLEEPMFQPYESQAILFSKGSYNLIPAEVACLNCNGSGQLRGDQKLLAYLYKNKHQTPFEMAGLTVESQAPIMVYREWHRHRTQSYNEMSARYTPLPDVNYVPSVERIMIGGGHLTKQAAGVVGSQELTVERAEQWRKMLSDFYVVAQRVYEWGLDHGIPKELARLDLPVGRYSRMRASGLLRNWLAFLTLRMDKSAQWEIRQYANQVGVLVKELFPKTWELFVEGKEVATK